MPKSLASQASTGSGVTPELVEHVAQAVLDLAPASRQRDARLISFNPADRRQNKKFRATVREPKTMTR